MPDPNDDDTAHAVTRFVIAAGQDDRLDRVVQRHFPDASRRRVADLFADGAVRIDGRLAKKGEHGAAGAEISIARPPVSAEDLRAQPDPEAAARLTVLYRDDDVIAVAKPAGMPSQPLRAGERGTAASGIVALHPECATVADDPRDGGLVHRLDIGTSGVLVAARHRPAWTVLRASFGAGSIAKEYLALTDAPPVAAECHEPLLQRGGRAVVDHGDGLTAHTRWDVEARFGERRLLRCHAMTGRMHQIRAHLAACGAPIAGDALYGGQPLAGLDGFFLHAARIRFQGRGRLLTIDAPLPPDRQAVLDAITAGS